MQRSRTCLLPNLIGLYLPPLSRDMRATRPSTFKVLHMHDLQIWWKYLSTTKALKTWLLDRLTCGFIDIGPRVTYQDGTTDAETFNGDGLHLSKSGTQILTNVFIETIPGVILL